MESRISQAVEKKNSGYNCAQAIICTYCDHAKIDEARARALGSSFGHGLGNMEGTCGAVTGAGMVLGLASNENHDAIRGMKQIMTKFQLRNGATQCKLLKGVGTGKVLRECSDCVADAAEFLEEELKKQGF